VAAWRPTWIALAVTALSVGVHVAAWGSRAPWGRAELEGAALAAVGLAWLSWAVAVFRAAGTPVGAGDTPLQLIEEGPYRFGRHPMYLGLTTTMIGTALAFGMPLLALGALALGALLATVHVPHEEAQLARRFGGWWRDYAGSTRRWF
jgi:protein-S-isoprenylcysteine O-methyltransferase Ste14